MQNLVSSINYLGKLRIKFLFQILTLENQGTPDIDEIANSYLGQEIWVSWPHMVEAKVVAVKVSSLIRKFKFCN